MLVCAGLSTLYLVCGQREKQSPALRDPAFHVLESGKNFSGSEPRDANADSENVSTARVQANRNRRVREEGRIQSKGFNFGAHI